MKIEWDSYTSTWVNSDEECECHQASGDTPQCRFHFESHETYRGVNFGNEYKAPLRLVH